LSSIEHQETRSTPRKLIQQINLANDPPTEAREVVDELLRGYGGDLNAWAHLQNVVIEMTRAIRNRYIANAEEEGRPTLLPDFESKEGENEDTVRMNHLNTTFQIIDSLGIAILPADVRILQGLGARTVAMKTATKNILIKLIKERRTLN
jgi:hypothetical protein